jgi:putative transcriptional regulator
MQSMLCLFRKVNLAFPLPDAAEDIKENSMKTKIRELRKQHKLSQEELAEAVGTTRQTITSIEVGKYTASLPLAYKIAHHFGLTIEEVFDFSDLEE